MDGLRKGCGRAVEGLWAGEEDDVARPFPRRCEEWSRPGGPRGRELLRPRGGASGRAAGRGRGRGSGKDRSSGERMPRRSLPPGPGNFPGEGLLHPCLGGPRAVLEAQSMMNPLMHPLNPEPPESPAESLTERITCRMWSFPPLMLQNWPSSLCSHGEYCGPVRHWRDAALPVL